jgi:hypothetical protein
MAAYPGELHLSATDGAYTGLQFVFRRHGTSYPQPSFSYKQSARFSRAEKWPTTRKYCGPSQLGHLVPGLDVNDSRADRVMSVQNCSVLKRRPGFSTGPFRRPRRVPSRRHRAKPQDHGAPVTRATHTDVCVSGLRVKRYQLSASSRRRSTPLKTMTGPPRAHQLPAKRLFRQHRSDSAPPTIGRAPQ